MQEDPIKELESYKRIVKSFKLLAWASILLVAGSIWFSFGSPGLDLIIPASKENVIVKKDIQENEDQVVDGIHLATGLIDDTGIELIKQNCLACHSSKLVTQNRMNRQGWKETIVWMQETQKLWDLGESESKILDYLAKNYAPKKAGRRKNLVINEWYKID